MSTTPRPTIPREFEDLHNKIASLTGQVRALESELRGYREADDAQTKKEEKAEQIERRREAQREKRQAAAAAALDTARAEAIRAIARLLPQAVKQARAGKPALLRMILRATR